MLRWSESVIQAECEHTVTNYFNSNSSSCWLIKSLCVYAVVLWTTWWLWHWSQDPAVVDLCSFKSHNSLWSFVKIIPLHKTNCESLNNFCSPQSFQSFCWSNKSKMPSHVDTVHNTELCDFQHIKVSQEYFSEGKIQSAPILKQLLLHFYNIWL